MGEVKFGCVLYDQNDMFFANTAVEVSVEVQASEQLWLRVVLPGALNDDAAWPVLVEYVGDHVILKVWDSEDVHDEPDHIIDLTARARM
jgi:hypothetical protein